MSSLNNHGSFGSGETLTGNLDFFVVHTVVDIAEGDMTDIPSAVNNLGVLIQAISTGAQPIIVAVKTAVVDLSDATIAAAYGLGTDFVDAATQVHTLRFAIEHTETFGDLADAGDVTKPISLAARIQGLPTPFVSNSIEKFELADAAKKNVSVVGYAVL